MNAAADSGENSTHGVEVRHPKSRHPNDRMLTTQLRMKACSTEAKQQQLNGEDRKAFLRECM